MALDKSKIIQYNLPENCYFNDQLKKTQIFIHHTAGNSNPFIVIDGWKAKADKISTAFVIGGKPTIPNAKWKDGDIVQAFSSKCHSYHLGLKPQVFTQHGLIFIDLHLSSIAIEICNWGFLTQDSQGKFRNYVNGIVPVEEVIALDQPFRGYKYQHRYTDAQLLSLRDLLIYLCDTYNIPKTHFTNMFEVNKDALSGISGIWTHTSVRQDKFDCSPQPALRKILENLSLNSI